MLQLAEDLALTGNLALEPGGHAQQELVRRDTAKALDGLSGWQAGHDRRRQREDITDAESAQAGLDSKNGGGRGTPLVAAGPGGPALMDDDQAIQLHGRHARRRGVGACHRTVIPP
jgi:hypothetical protein